MERDDVCRGCAVYACGAKLQTHNRKYTYEFVKPNRDRKANIDSLARTRVGISHERNAKAHVSLLCIHNTYVFLRLRQIHSVVATKIQK